MIRGLTTVAAMLASGPALAGDPLAAHRWNARVVVVAAPSPEDPDLLRQRALLAAAAEGLRDRDVVVREAVGDGPAARALRAHLGLPAAAFRVVLVGKDGTRKRTEPAPVPAETLFSAIDAMPMRRDEMRRAP